MEHLALDGVALLAALAVAALLGVFVAQYLKDKVSGVPSPLRAALQATEAAAVQSLKDAQAKVVSEVAGALSKPAAKIAAELAPPATPAALVPAASGATGA